MIRPFDSLLIANRGEIACRIIRTAKAIGLRTVAVFSDADCDALHVKQADHAVHIGGSTASESYLDGKKIIQVAKDSGAGAIHPGYGFLSENAGFARAVDAAGLVFIGPSADAIALMGDKAQAKQRMIKAGVPCVPGYQGDDQTDARLVQEARKIGAPVMVKAAAGGGGRGMRLVDDLGALPDALSSARSEAQNAFGNDRLILEKAVTQARHVEIQIFADTNGHTLHLGERDCSVQRRHQKVIEEAPCPVMTPTLRAEMGAAAVKAAQDIGYVGAGTVEFLLDGDGQFYFLEMNTRLQVEHPVTEMVTGLDLVEWQLRIAQGEDLPMQAIDFNMCGHAIEARLYAEDPADNFLPATGQILRFESGEIDGIRVDTGVETGGAVSPFYDPMIAKAIAHGPTRDIARRRLIQALGHTHIFGVTTNRDYLIELLRHEVFAEGSADTGFISTHFQPKTPVTETPPYELIEAAMAFHLSGLASHSDPLMNWYSAQPLSTSYSLNGTDVQITPQGNTHYICEIGNIIKNIYVTDFNMKSITLKFDQTTKQFNYLRESDSRLHISSRDRTQVFTNNHAQISASIAEVSEGEITSPMHGSLTDVKVQIGDHVRANQTLAIVEAMKMQHSLLSPCDGEVTEIFAQAGQQVAAGQILINIRPDG